MFKVRALHGRGPICLTETDSRPMNLLSGLVFVSFTLGNSATHSISKGTPQTSWVQFAVGPIVKCLQPMNYLCRADAGPSVTDLFGFADLSRDRYTTIRLNRLSACCGNAPPRLVRALLR